MQAGLDSLGAVELRNAVASNSGINVPATLAFDYPTPTALSEFVAASLPQTEAQLFEMPLPPATEESEGAAVDPQENHRENSFYSLQCVGLQHLASSATDGGALVSCPFDATVKQVDVNAVGRCTN